MDEDQLVYLPIAGEKWIHAFPKCISVNYIS